MKMDKNLIARIDKTMSNDDYHRHGAVSHSGIMRFMHNPNSYHAEYMLGQREETQPMKIGTLLHQSIMEPEVFKNGYVVPTKYSGTGSVALNREEIAKHKNSGATIITEQELVMIEMMRDNFRRSPFLVDSLAAGNIEHSFFFEIGGVEAKARPDFYKPKVAFDIKSTADIGSREFSKSIYTYGYHVQGAMMIDALRQNGIEIDYFVIVAFEKRYPYTTTQFILSDNAIELGRATYKKTIAEIEEYKNKNLWEVPNEIDLPDWAYKEEGLL